MRHTAYPMVALCVIGLSFSAANAQAPDEAFKAAYATAQVANKKAGELKNQWTTTSASLAAAQRAADGGDYDDAIKLAKQAESFANASIAQVQRESKLWKESELR